MLGVAVFGATGRMGMAVTRVVTAASDATIVGACTEPGHAALGQDAGAQSGLPVLGVILTDQPAAAAGQAQLVIDFSLPAALQAHLDACRAAGVPLVLGTTGLSDVQQAQLREAARQIPILYGRNMSIGVNVFTELTRQAARFLGGEWEVEITEAHHRHKVDAPSGTALQLGEVIANERGTDLQDIAVIGRSGHTGSRGAGAIGFSSIRAGSIVGDHSVQFVTDAEIVTLAHHAVSRDVFAAGALQAARWLVNQPPGLYGMRDVLGFRD